MLTIFRSNFVYQKYFQKCSTCSNIYTVRLFRNMKISFWNFRTFKTIYPKVCFQKTVFLVTNAYSVSEITNLKCTFTTLIVFQQEPWVVKTKDSSYQGFVIDVLEKVAEIIQFDYVIQSTTEEEYRYIGYTGAYEGLIGDLVNVRNSFQYIHCTLYGCK